MTALFVSQNPDKSRDQRKTEVVPIKHGEQQIKKQQRVRFSDNRSRETLCKTPEINLLANAADENERNDFHNGHADGPVGVDKCRQYAIFTASSCTIFS